MEWGSGARMSLYPHSVTVVLPLNIWKATL